MKNYKQKKKNKSKIKTWKEIVIVFFQHNSITAL